MKRDAKAKSCDDDGTSAHIAEAEREDIALDDTPE